MCPPRERDLQFFWKKLKAENILSGFGGEKIKILSSGTWNFEEGPDFLNAKFAIDDKTEVGDVEIHIKSSDWNAHGHSNDPRYGKVRLHAVLINDLPENIRAGIITVILPATAKFAKGKSSPNMKFGVGDCKKLFSSFDDNTAHSLLLSAGIARFEEKAYDATGEIIAHGFDNALMRRIFEALGYKKNKDNFIALFERLANYDSFSESEFIDALIWGESALLPDPTMKKIHPEMKDTATRLWKEWWRHRNSDKPPIKWIKSGDRPLNSPERRIAGLCVIVEKTGRKLFAQIAKNRRHSNSPKEFADTLIKLFSANDPLWDHWTNFKDKRKFSAAVIGEMRAIDIVVNTVLPFLFAKFASEGNEKSRDFCLETYKAMPRPQDNIRIKTAANKWFEPPSRADAIIRDAPSAQGAIFFMKKFCEKNSGYCHDCELLSELKKCKDKSLAKLSSCPHLP